MGSVAAAVEPPVGLPQTADREAFGLSSAPAMEDRKKRLLRWIPRSCHGDFSIFSSSVQIFIKCCCGHLHTGLPVSQIFVP